MIRELSVALLLGAPPRDGWFGTDKVKHFFMSAFVQSATFSAARAAGASGRAAQATGALATTVVGIGREVHDRRRGRIFSVKDLAWDAAGGVAAASLLRRTK
jgi:putative lipoprotein